MGKYLVSRKTTCFVQRKKVVMSLFLFQTQPFIDLETLGIAFYISRPFKGHGLLTYWIMSPHLIDVTVSTKGFGRTVTNLNRSEIFTN